MGSLDTTRDSTGVPATDLSTMYAAALAAFPASCKGQYKIDGRDYTPPPPMDLLEVLFRIGNEQASRNGTTNSPPKPDLGISQATFGGAPQSQAGNWLAGK